MQKSSKGFTLVELLIVIGIVVILSVAVVLTLNPAELLRQARDSTRVSDLATLKSALALYLADVSSISLGAGQATCYTHYGTSTVGLSGCGQRFSGGTATSVTTTVGVAGNNGWIPVNLTAISSGAPISAYPIDPVAGTAGLYYAYRASGTVYEINAVLESTKYTSGGNNLPGRDGGTSSTVYEVGTDLSL